MESDCGSLLPCSIRLNLKGVAAFRGSITTRSMTTSTITSTTTTVTITTTLTTLT